ncbi:DUF2079 domain-containing protein [Alphaproteobacteria bacterium]|nr:DUF2079 domain-containing protein [Alphaproteobacteria bacterium]
MSCLKYYNLNTAIFDLGVFMSHFSGITTLGLNKLFYGHAQPLIIFYEFFYSLFPLYLGPYLILILQSLFISLPIFIISRMYGSIFVWGYMLIFPIWYNALFDFHMDHLVIFFQFLFFYFVKNNEFGKATLASFSLIFVKEIFALQTGVSSFFLLINIILLRNNPEIKKNIKLYIFYSIFLFCIGFGYFYYATNYLIPYFTSTNENAIQMSQSFSWLGNNITEIIYNVIISPLNVINNIIFDSKKLLYILVVFGGFGFAAFISPSPIILATPILGISLLSLHPNHTAFYNHYTCGLIAPFYVSLCNATNYLKNKYKVNYFIKKNISRLFIIGLVFSNMTLSPSPLGWIYWSDLYWQFGFSAYIPTQNNRNNIIKDKIIKLFENDNYSIISVQNSFNFSYITHRKYLLVFPDGVFEEAIVPEAIKYNDALKTNYKKVSADYVILDFKKPLFWLDKGCKWRNNICTDKLQLSKITNIFDKLLKSHKVIFKYDGFYIFKKPFILKR